MNTAVKITPWQDAAASLATPVRVVAGLPDLDDVRGIVSRTLSHAKSLGRDELTQTRAAALAIVAVRPDVTFLQACSAIGRMQAAGAV